MQRSSASKFGVISIISTVIVLILIIGLAIFTFLVEPEETDLVVQAGDLVVTVDPDAVDPALAISLLAGVSVPDVVDQAISKSRPGTALATIIHSPQLGARDAAGDLLLLGDKFTAREDKAQGKLSYQLAGTLATLSPDLSDTLRADIFLQAGMGLTELGYPVLAKIYLDQAFLVATESAYLQAAYRAGILEGLNQAYLDLGLEQEARRSMELSLAPANLAALPEKPLVLPAGQAVARPLEVQQAESQRWRAAQFVVKDLVDLGGTARPENLAALHDALLAEELVKTEFFDQALQAETQLSGKVGLMKAKIEWQSIKYRVAKRGFGISLVPEWETQLDSIQAELSASYEDLYDLYSEIIVAIPIASDIDRATEEALRRQILDGQLGLYPNYPGEILKAQLLKASATLIETQPNTELRVSYLSVDSTDYYTLISDQDVLNQEERSDQAGF